MGHLKQDYRLSRNWLRGSQGDEINLLMAACAWNLRKWMVAFFLFENGQLRAMILLQNAFLSPQKPSQLILTAWVVLDEYPSA